MIRDLIFCGVVVCDALLCVVLICDVLFCGVLVCDVLLCGVVVCDALLCVGLICVVLLCGVVVFDALLCVGLRCVVLLLHYSLSVMWTIVFFSNFLLTHATRQPGEVRCILVAGVKCVWQHKEQGRTRNNKQEQ